MAKAIYGFVGVGSDYRLVTENQRLQRQIRELEEHIRTLESLIQPSAVDSEILLEKEPALT